MSKLFKNQAVGLPEARNQQGKHLANHVRSIYAYVKKAKK